MSVVQQRIIKRRVPRSGSSFDHAIHSPAGPVRPLRVVLALNPDGVQAEISGELDFSSAPRLDRILRVIEGLGHPITVDLSGVSFTDSSGMSPLFESASRRAAQDAEPICVTGLSHPCRRVLDVLSDLPEVQLLTRVGSAQ